MAPPRTLINGYGRIGRLAHRRALGWHGAPLAPFDVVWVNELGAAESAAYLLQFDSTHGRFGETEVGADGAAFSVSVPTPGGGVGETMTAQVGYSRAETPAEVGRRKRAQLGFAGARARPLGLSPLSLFTPPPPIPSSSLSDPLLHHRPDRLGAGMLRRIPHPGVPATFL